MKKELIYKHCLISIYLFMKRFKEYSKNKKNDLEKGVINISYDYKFGNVDDIQFPTKKHLNRAFTGDVVYYQTDDKIGQVIDIERQDYGVIIGVLQIMSLTTYGINKKGAHYYMFKPENRYMPRFYVAFDLKTKTNKLYKEKGYNIYCSICFNKWTIDSKYPQGSIVQIIGTLGEIEAEYEYVLYKHTINYKINKIKKDKDFDEEVYFHQKGDFSEGINIISIDPPGCTDIDDALQYRRLSEDTFEIGIHIADVSRYVKYMSKIDIEARQRLSTIYSPTKRIDMLPPWLSTDICSLKPGKPKYTASLYVRFEEKDDNLELINYSFTKQVIISQKAFTYDEVDELLEKRKNKYSVCDLMDAANKLQKKYKFNICSEQSHKLIEVFMVFANMIAATHLIEKATVKYPLIRTHYSKTSFEQKKLDEIKDPNLRHHMYILNMNRATYEIDNNKDIFHTGLGIKYYTHFTSPIRRYADIIVHRLLFDDFSKDESDICSTINEVNYKTRKAQRDFDKLKIIDELKDKSLETEGYITDIYKYGITIYVIPYKLGVGFRLYDRKFDSILDYELNDDNTSLKIINKHTNKQTIYTLLDKVKIRMVPYLREENFKNKLKVRILGDDNFII